MVGDMNKILMIPLALSLTLGALACSGNDRPPSLAAQLDQARVLNSDLRGNWDGTQKMLKTTLTAVEELPVLQIDAASLEVDLMRKSLFECFQSPAGAGDASARSGAAIDGTPAAPIPPCEGADVDALLNLGQAAGPEIDGFYRQKLAAMAMVRLNLRTLLPTRTKDMTERHIQARKVIDEIEFSAQREKKLVDEGEIEDADRSVFRADYEALQQELTSLKALLSETERAPSEIDTTVRAAIDDLLSGLTRLGAK